MHDLFDRSEDAYDEVRGAFDDWVAARIRSASTSRASRALRPDSVGVYRDMSGAFASWCARHGCRLATIDETDLGAFLGALGRARDVSDRYATRMLALLARIDRHDARRRGRPVNPTFGALRQRARFRLAEHRSEDALPAFLTAREARSLVDFATARGDLGRGGYGSWQDLRNRTAVAIQLGAGVTPGEARLLTLDQIRVDGGERKGEPWKLALPGNGNFPARETPLARWAGRQLGQWLAVRAEAGIPGPQVFPSTRSGRVWSKVAFVDACRDVMRAGGVAHPSGGSFKLRHTFAIRQLTRHSPEDVARWLGIQDVQQMTRYTRVLQAPVELV